METAKGVRMNIGLGIKSTLTRLLLAGVLVTGALVASGVTVVNVAQADTDTVTTQSAAGETFYQAFASQHTAEVVATYLGKVPSDTITSDLIDSVTNLDLSGNSITDISGIEVFKNLQILTLNDNDLTSLPDTIGDLSSLQILELNDNDLTSLPDAIGDLSSLQSLYIGDNDLTSLPDTISNLSSLEALYLSDNDLTSLPESFSNLSSLAYLYLSDNDLISLPDTFGDLRLFALYADNNDLTSLPESFGNIDCLNYLSLDNNDLTSLPESFVNISNLDYFGAANNSLINLTSAQYQKVASITYYAPVDADPVVGSKLLSQIYSRQNPDGYVKADYTFDALPVYEQVSTYGDGSSVSYTLTQPDGTIVHDQTLAVTITDGTITFDKALLQQVGTYILTASIAGGELDGSVYTQTFTLGVSTPTLTLVDPTGTNVTVGGDYTDPGYSAYDAVDGDLTSQVEVDRGGLDTSAPGTYTITYSVTNSFGETTTATRTVTVAAAGTDSTDGTSTDNSTSNGTTSSDATLPKTGDNITTLALGLLLAAGAGTGLVVFSRKKFKKD
jgi:LPXTG-motif cell wall-anchored protein